MNDLDANKTPLTHRITAVAMGYLSGAGFKPVETEVPVAPGWIADIASFIYPTMTESKKMKLNKKFDGATDNGDFWYSELHFKYGFPLTAIVEVKTSRGDFETDRVRKFMAAPPAHLCYLAYPRKIMQLGNTGVDIKSVPSGWIGLECSDDGKKLLRIIYQTYGIHAQNPGDIANLIAQVAIRRHHRTAYAEMRAMMKSYRGEKKGFAKGNPFTAVSLVAEYLRGDGHDIGEDIKTILWKYGYKVPQYLEDDLKYLEGLKKEISNEN